VHRRKYIYVYPSRRYAQRGYCIRYILPRNNKYKRDKIYPKYLMPKRDDMYPRDGSYPRGDGVIHMHKTDSMYPRDDVHKKDNMYTRGGMRLVLQSVFYLSPNLRRKKTKNNVVNDW
jgi:hypothetical protein